MSNIWNPRIQELVTSNNLDNIKLAYSLLDDPRELSSWYYTNHWEKLHLPMFKGSMLINNYFQEVDPLRVYEPFEDTYKYLKNAYAKHMGQKSAGVNTESE